MNKILKLTFILFLVCAIVAGVLGVVNELTYETIEAQQRMKTEKAFAAVLPAAGYEALDVQIEGIDSISKATDGAGYVVQSTFSGSQGSITLVVGVDNDYKCTGISVIKHSETSGLGANAAASSEIGVTWRAQFVGVDSSVAIAKEGGSIDALSGATITSRAVTNATAASIKAVESLG